ncbi:MAG: HAD hydrolase family protein [Cyanobacteria bacterium P01_F01_bin.143]
MMIVFTNLDSCLINQDNDYKLALPVIEKLKTKGIPLILVTSKTRAEVEDLRTTLGLSDPFIVENSSAIFIPQSDRSWKTAEATLESDYYVKTFGCNYIEARAGLKIIQSTLKIPNLKGFGDFEDTKIQSLIGISKKAAKKAKTREFSEPFITPQDIDTSELNNTAAEFGFKILSGSFGGDRFNFMILGINVSQGKAVQWLIDNYQPKTIEEPIITLGLGTSSQDGEMLEKMDTAVVIINTTETSPSLDNKEWQTTNSPGIQGWAEAITKICQL